MCGHNTTPLYCDNNTARQLTENQHWHPKIKHFHVCYHMTQDLIDLDELKVFHIHSSENVMDILTKPLGPSDFTHLRSYLGIHSSHSA